MNQKRFQQYQLLLIIFSLLYMLPLVIISFFNRPSADDFNYSWRTFQTLQNGGGLLSLLGSALETTIYYWHNWQGLYTSAFVLSLQPGIWGNSCYIATGLLMLLLIAGSTIYTSCYITGHILAGTLWDGMSIGCLMSFMMIQFMPSCVEGLFWFNGTMNYGLFYALMLFLLCSCIKIALADPVKLRYAAVPILLGFLVEGGNHVTAFMSLLLVAAFAVFGLFSGRKKAAMLYMLTLLAMAGCFLLNILSPGTKVRQSAFSGPGIIPSILLSVRHGVLAVLTDGISLSLMPVLLLAIPILYPLASRFRERTGFRFRFPFLIPVLSLGWISAMFCPPVYAMGSPGAGRLFDVVYYCIILLAFLNVFYFCGWISRLTAPAAFSEVHPGRPAAALLLLAALFICSLHSWSAKACVSLVSGEASAYCLESDRRYEMCIAGRGEDVVLPQFSVQPELLFFSDITEDRTEWINTAMARYFGLNSVRLSSP